MGPGTHRHIDRQADMVASLIDVRRRQIVAQLVREGWTYDSEYRRQLTDQLMMQQQEKAARRRMMMFAS